MAQTVHCSRSSHAGPSEALFLVKMVSNMSPHGVRGKGELLGPFSKDTNPLPKPPKATTGGVHFNMLIYKGLIQSMTSGVSMGLAFLV